MKDRAQSERIGNAIRKRRTALEMSQEGFADSIKMHRAYYGALERGEINLTLRTLRRVAGGLGIKAWEILRDADF